MLHIDLELLSDTLDVMLVNFGIFVAFAFFYMGYLQFSVARFSRQYDQAQLQQVQVTPLIVKNFILQMQRLILDTSRSVWLPFGLTLGIFLMTSGLHAYNPFINETAFKMLGALGVFIPAILQTNLPKRAGAIFEQVVNPPIQVPPPPPTPEKP